MTQDQDGDSLSPDPRWEIDANQAWNRLRVTPTREREFYSEVKQQASTGGQTRAEQYLQQQQQQQQQQSQTRGNADGGAQATQRRSESSSGNVSNGPVADPETTSAEHDGGDDLGHTSDAWKPAASCLFLGSLTFLFSIAAFLGYTATMSNIFLYTVLILSVMYVVLRFAFSYFVYKDAKSLAFHTRERRGHAWTPETYGWKPRPYFWAVLTFCMPPFVEYGPAAMYFTRRRQKTGVP